MLARISILLLLFEFCVWADTVYVVQKGDTLTKIGSQYHLSIKEILQANMGLRPDAIRVGQKINIPSPKGKSLSIPLSQEKPPFIPSAKKKREERREELKKEESSKSVYHTVQRGDTLTKISRIYGISISGLRKINDLKSDTLYIGQKLLVQTPRGEAEPKYVFLSKVKARIDAPRRLRDWEYVVVHHSGTENGNAKIFDYYHSNICHMENGLAYHFVIGNGTDSGDGEIEVGNRWIKQLQGGHVSDESINQVGIGICLVGDFNKTRPTSRQMASLVELISYLKGRMRSKSLILEGHREVVPNHTDCPGRYFPMKALHRLFDDKLKSSQ